MKRKKLSLFSSLLSLMVALTYLTLAIVLIIRAVGAKEYVPTAEDSLWIIKVLKRLKEAGFNIFFSITGVVLSVILAIYRLTLTYFYAKVSKSDEAFYKARLGEIVFFSVLAGCVIGVTAWFCFGLQGVFPVEIQPFILALFISYIFLCAMPILEIPLVYGLKLLKKKPMQAVPTKLGVVQELDELADITAKATALKQEEKKVQEEVVYAEKKVQEVVVPRTRKVVEYVTPLWDRNDVVYEENSKSKYTKTGVRKKNRKPSYNSAILRISKPLSRRGKLKAISLSKIRSNYSRQGNCSKKRR